MGGTTTCKGKGREGPGHRTAFRTRVPRKYSSAGRVSTDPGPPRQIQPPPPPPTHLTARFKISLTKMIPLNYVGV